MITNAAVMNDPLSNKLGNITSNDNNQDDEMDCRELMDSNARDRDKISDNDENNDKLVNKNSEECGKDDDSISKQTAHNIELPINVHNGETSDAENADISRTVVDESHKPLDSKEVDIGNELESSNKETAVERVKTPEKNEELDKTIKSNDNEVEIHKNEEENKELNEVKMKNIADAVDSAIAVLDSAIAKEAGVLDDSAPSPIGVDDNSCNDVIYASTEPFVETTFEIPLDPASFPSPEPPDSPTDCMMIVENVQVDVDPESLFMQDPDDGEGDEDDDDEVEVVETREAEPVSLLTSSDESDVIIEEPHIDTVEVSDETDEEDRPLRRLAQVVVLRKPNKLKKRSSNATKDDYGCTSCPYTTKNKKELSKHGKTHANSILKCKQCKYTTESASQFSVHQRKHREEKRFHCHLCDYKAKHKMSLVYHMNSHKTDQKYKCRYKKCIFKTNQRSNMHAHLKQNHDVQIYSCKNCDFSSQKRGDLRRHRATKHKNDSDDDDDEYYPGKDI